MKQPEERVLEQLLKLQLLKEKDVFNLIQLYNLLGSDNFFKVIDLVGGQTIEFPTKEYFKDIIQLSLCYLYRNINGYSWSQIKEKLNQPDLPVNSLSKRVAGLSNRLSQLCEELNDRK